MINPNQPDFDNTPASDRRICSGYTPLQPAELPAISIITPFYNIAPDVFQETVRSVRRQLFQQWEWIIVDDGSTQPETVPQLAALSQADARIRLIVHPENRGLSAARNTGIQAAQTDFVVLLDGDDLLEPTALEKWLWFLFTQPQFSFTRGYSVRFGESPHLWTRSFEQAQTFLVKNQMEPTSMVRREVWQHVGGFDETMRQGLEDWDFWLKCAAHSFWGATVPEFLNWYRLRPQQHSRWPALRNAPAMLEVRDEMKRRYSRLFAGDLPTVRSSNSSTPLIPLHLPCANRLAKAKRQQRALMITSTLSAALQVDLPEQITDICQLSICAILDSQPADLAETSCFTSDIFVLPNFMQICDYPRFLCYLIGSRQVDVVVLYRSTLGYNLLPFFQVHFPQVVLLDYVDDYSSAMQSVRYQAWLVSTLADSVERRQWLIEQGCRPARIVFGQDWIPFLNQIEQPRVELAIAQDTGRLLATLAVESSATGSIPGNKWSLPNNDIPAAKEFSGEELAGIFSSRKLLKALGFKLGNQPGLRWLYRLRNIGKWLTGT